MAAAIRCAKLPGNKSKLRLLALAGGAFCFFALRACLFAHAEPSVYPTGTTIYDPAKAYNSFVLFVGGDDVSRLIDLNGKVVHEWKYNGQPVAFIDPALVSGQRGHIFVTLETEEGKGTDLVPGRVQTRIRKTVGEIDWDGKKYGHSAPARPEAARSSITTSRVCRTAIRWSSRMSFIPCLVSRLRRCSTTSPMRSILKARSSGPGRPQIISMK